MGLFLPKKTSYSLAFTEQKPLLGVIKFITNISNRNNLGKYAVKADSPEDLASIDYTNTCRFMIIGVPHGQDPQALNTYGLATLP